MTLATTYSLANTAGIDLTAVYTASTAGTWGENVQPGPPFAPGQIVWSLVGSAFVYVTLSTGGATGTGYAIVMPLGSYSAAVMMSNSVGALSDKIGIWTGSTAGVSGDSGWVQVYGPCAAIRANAAAVVSTALASTSTAGALDDATTTGTKNISGIVFTQTVTGAGNFTGELNWPIVGSTN